MIPFNHLGWFFNLCGSSAYPRAAVEALCEAIQNVAQGASVLNRGGVLFIYEFDPSAFLGRSLCLAEKLLGEPGHFFTPGQLKTLLEGHGLDVQINGHGWRYSLTSRLP